MSVFATTIAPLLAQTAEHRTPETFLEIVFSGGWVGITIMVLIILSSIVAMALAAEQFFALRASVLMPEGLRERVYQQLAAGNLKGAFQACDAQPSFLAYILRTALAEAESGWSAVEKALEDATAEQTARLLRRVEYLAVIGNIAPMLGLLGTVVGLTFAFHEVASTQGVARAADLADGIYRALVSTVGGLIVAIPALAVYAALRNRVDQLAAETAGAALHALGPVKRVLVSSRPAGAFIADTRRWNPLMRLPTRQRSSFEQINMTPMIDVTFQLIIFFLLSSHLAQQETQLELDLPTADSGRPTVNEERPRLSVNVTADGQVMLGSAATPVTEMSARLRVECERLGDDLEVRIRADRSVSYSAVEPILLACASAGIWNVTFAVHKKVESEESSVKSQSVLSSP